MEGEATYEGDATGVYSHGTNGGRRNEFFDADVTLMAGFGNTSDLGTINGWIDHFMVDGKGLPGGPVLTLMTADIGGSSSGFHTGDTSMRYNNDAFTGKWGGQFYNDGAPAAADNPGAVAGTFGAANGGGDESFVGVFGAYHQPTTN